MKQVSKPLIDFINDFNLAHPENGVCFEATIHLKTHSGSTEIISEVHIVTIGAKKIDTIYLLSPDRAWKGFPDMFQSNVEEFSYLPNDSLIIKGYDSRWGKYSAHIRPENKVGKDNSLERLNALENN